MTKSKKTTYQIETLDGPRPWAVVEKSQYGKDVLKTFVSHQDARRFLSGLQKSAVPRLSALMSFGFE